MKNLIKRLNTIEEVCLTFSLMGIAIITFIETALRYTISYTFPWFMELANYTLIFITFLAASIGVKYGTHFSMEALPQTAPDRISHLLKMAGYFISGFLCILFVYFGIKHLIFLKSFGAKSSAMQIPMFIPYIPIPLFSITMAFRFFTLSSKHFKGFIKREPFDKVLRKSL